MKRLSNEDMMNIKGGGVAAKFIAGLIGGTIVFLIGVVDGLINPKKCN